MRALITGITGFAGKHLEYFLRDKAEVYGTSRTPNPEKHIFVMDLLSEGDISEIIKKVKPTHIFHLAGLSNVKNSWEHKADFIQANVMGTINLLEAVRKADYPIRVIAIGSSEEYGIVPAELEQVCEETPLHPVSPYGISKSAIHMLVNLYHKSYGLEVIHARPFNHIGPDQKRGFVTTDFAYQIALINKGRTKDSTIRIGNLDVVRDFTDVRDIVEAYYHIACLGKAGVTYNVCKGKGIRIQDLLDVLLGFSGEKINLIVDPDKLRIVDIPRLVGDPRKLLSLTDWRPQRRMENTLKEIYEFWLNEL